MTTSTSIQPLLYGPTSLHAVCMAPAGACRARVLLVSPLFEEKRCAHRALFTCARALAEAGAAVLIPDVTGIGNSAGSLAETDVAQWSADLRAAATVLNEHGDGPLILVGCRAGALLAVRALADGLSAERLLLWQPVLAGRAYIRQLRTRRMIQDSITGEAPVIGAHEVEGQELSAALHAELDALALPETPPALDLRLLQCSFTEKLLTEYERLVARWGAERVRVRCVTAEPFWNPHSPGDYADLGAALVEEVLG